MRFNLLLFEEKIKRISTAIWARHLPFPDYFSFTNSIISQGWQFRISQISSKVENRIALAFPVFEIERLTVVIPISSANSLEHIFRFARITSGLITIAKIILVDYSDSVVFPFLMTSEKAIKTIPIASINKYLIISCNIWSFGE